jgi:integrase
VPRIAKELSALAVLKLSKPGFHSAGGVKGLALRVSIGGAKYWVLRIVVNGKRRDLGLGSYPSIPLAMARERARLLREGKSLPTPSLPKEKPSTSPIPSFQQAAKIYIDTYRTVWRNPKHAQQWTRTLETYVYPVMGRLSIAEITTDHVLQVLRPIWGAKTETASRIRGRIEQILDWGHAHGYRGAENAAKWQGLLDKILPNPKKISPHKHHRTIPIGGIQDFYSRLRQQPGIAARALEMVLLTAARSGEVRGMQWEEIDLHTKTWTVPASRMKSGRIHRVPLSEAAIQLLQASPCPLEGIVFKSPRGKALSDMSLSAVMRRMCVDAVPHGLRSTFRDWVAEKTNYPNELGEMALAHVITNKAEAAYRRGDMLERRREMMNDWEIFLGVKK